MHAHIDDLRYTNPSTAPHINPPQCQRSLYGIYTRTHARTHRPPQHTTKRTGRGRHLVHILSTRAGDEVGHSLSLCVVAPCRIVGTIEGSRWLGRARWMRTDMQEVGCSQAIRTRLPPLNHTRLPTKHIHVHTHIPPPYPAGTPTRGRARTGKHPRCTAPTAA